MTSDILSNALLVLIFTSFVIERGLSAIYEYPSYIKRYGIEPKLKFQVAFLVSLLFVFSADLDVISIMFQSIQDSSGTAPSLTRFGNPLADSVLLTFSYCATALIVSGGCKPFVKLFRDVWGVQSSMSKEVQEFKKSLPENIGASARAASAGSENDKKSIHKMLDNGFKFLQVK